MAAADAAEAAVATSTAFIVAASTCSVYSTWAPERNAPDETKNTTRGIVLLHERKERRGDVCDQQIRQDFIDRNLAR